jgi:hypothetical protein
MKCSLAILAFALSTLAASAQVITVPTTTAPGLVFVVPGPEDFGPAGEPVEACEVQLLNARLDVHTRYFGLRKVGGECIKPMKFCRKAQALRPLFRCEEVK